jgi:hypothetical protein
MKKNKKLALTAALPLLFMLLTACLLSPPKGLSLVHATDVCPALVYRQTFKGFSRIRLSDSKPTNASVAASLYRRGDGEEKTKFIKENMKNSFENLRNNVGNFFENFENNAKKFSENLGNNMKNSFESFGNNAKKFFENAINDTMESTKTVNSEINAFLKQLCDKIKNFAA